MSVKVKGLDKAIADLNKKFINSVYPAVRDTLESTAIDIEIEATRDAPSSYQIGDATINLSFIKQKINKKVSNNGFSWNVGLDVPTTGEQWEAWMEFGTGLSARDILSNPKYSAEVREIARRYYRNGKGRIVGKPYLMPAFYRNTANLVNDMVTEINKALK
jgi:hypothetical protein